jgi:hypothetical protein
VDWLRLQPGEEGLSWFGPPEKTNCTVTWTEKESVRAQGYLDRVIRFDPRTRSLTAAIRIQPAQAAQGAPVPLVQGMFCRVDIAGRSLEKVFALPRTAVSFEQTVFIVQDNRLRTRKVEVARIEESTAFVRKGLQEGEQVIVTRLENPLENSLVNIEESDTGVETEEQAAGNKERKLQ